LALDAQEREVLRDAAAGDDEIGGDVRERREHDVGVAEHLGVPAAGEELAHGVAAAREASDLGLEYGELLGEALGEVSRARARELLPLDALHAEQQPDDPRRQPGGDQAADLLDVRDDRLGVVAVAVGPALRGKEPLLLVVPQHPGRNSGSSRQLADSHALSPHLTFT